MKKKIVFVILIIISILWTNIAITLAATKTELQNEQSEIKDECKNTGSSKYMSALLKKKGFHK